jgi:aspartyl-tRNA(Asn)/glutamyl-tRNA(Gln) amidotransferase subunit C
MRIEDMKETAALAHLNLGEDELAAAFPAFEQMLGYFAAMQGADGDREAFPEAPPESPLSSALARTVESGFFRTDNHGENPSGLSENLLNNGGERDGRFLVIPNVL